MTKEEQLYREAQIALMTLKRLMSIDPTHILEKGDIDKEKYRQFVAMAEEFNAITQRYMNDFDWLRRNYKDFDKICTELCKRCYRAAGQSVEDARNCVGVSPTAKHEIKLFYKHVVKFSSYVSSFNSARGFSGLSQNKFYRGEFFGKQWIWLD